MLRRARPKYLTNEHFQDLEDKSPLPEDELFFISGRSALKFFFRVYSEYLGKQLAVAMQSFNCKAVILPALETDCRIILLDINLDDFSITPNELKSLVLKPDILILTHYQGIPNQQYLEIKHYCEEHSILLVDDCAQTEYSYINNILVGSLSDVILRSFTFDKPFTCYRGGSIDVANLSDTSLKSRIIQEYAKIGYEGPQESNQDIEKLKLIYEYSGQRHYFRMINDYKTMKFLKKYEVLDKVASVLSGSRILKFMYYNIFWLLLDNIHIKLVYNLIKQLLIQAGVVKGEIVVERQDCVKTNLVLKQRLRYHFDDREVSALERFLNHNQIETPKFENCIVNWNRYSILDKDRRITKLLKQFDIQFGNYNWPIPLHKLYASNKKVITTGRYKNSEYASEYVLNIPVWSDFFRNVVRNIFIHQEFKA